MALSKDAFNAAMVSTRISYLSFLEQLKLAIQNNETFALLGVEDSIESSIYPGGNGFYLSFHIDATDLLGSMHIYPQTLCIKHLIEISCKDMRFALMISEIDQMTESGITTSGPVCVYRARLTETTIPGKMLEDAFHIRFLARLRVTIRLWRQGYRFKLDQIFHTGVCSRAYLVKRIIDEKSVTDVWSHIVTIASDGKLTSNLSRHRAIDDVRECIYQKRLAVESEEYQKFYELMNTDDIKYPFGVDFDWVHTPVQEFDCDGFENWLHSCKSTQISDLIDRSSRNQKHATVINDNS